MGNLFLEYIEKNPLSCKYCNTHITSKDTLINDIPIETMYNEAKKFGLIVNRLLISNPNWCSYTNNMRHLICLMIIVYVKTIFRHFIYIAKIVCHLLDGNMTICI